jgi:Holliday junction resolvasome RuvABC endonuclease subunit
MLSLGIDPSLSDMGWCIHDPWAVGKKRVVDKGRFSSPADEVFIARNMGLRACICDLLTDYPEVSIVGVESPIFGESYSEGAYGLFLYVNEAIYLHRKDVVYFDPSTVKSLAKEDPDIRKGKMFKSDMVTLARADTGVTTWNNDEADAYHVARFAARFLMLLNGEITEDVLLPSEQHTFMRSHTFTKGKHAGETHRDGILFRENDRFFRFSKLG